MKKALSLFLAVLMICGCFAIGTSAINPFPDQSWFGNNGEPAKPEQVVMVFDLNGGKMKEAVVVYDYATGATAATTDVTGTWIKIPSAYNAADLTPGTWTTLPAVQKADYDFVGWELVAVSGDGVSSLHQVYPAAQYIIPTGTAGTVIQFRAQWSASVVEEDTLTKILGILAKVFGAIIGILLYKGDTAAGVALVEKMLAGVLG